MKFHGMQTMYELYCPALKPQMTPSQYYGAVIAKAIRAAHGSPRSRQAATAKEAFIENMWWMNVRPYYKVWPSVMAALSKMRLDVIGNELEIQDRVILVRFAVGYEPRIGERVMTSVLSCVFSSTPDRTRSLIIEMDFGKNSTDIEDIDTATMALPLGSETLECMLARLEPVDHDGTTPIDCMAPLMILATRISLCVHIMADDPSIIQPDVLAADRERFDKSTDPSERQRLIEKAKKRGIVGWRIGEQYEVCPHFRRPHFGLRWTEKGRRVPRIVPIKGAIVHRSRLTAVPTGYIDEIGREIEQ